MIKRIVIKFTFILFVSFLNAQVSYESNTEFGEILFVPSKELKEKTLNIINTKTRFTNQEIQHIKSSYFFELKDGSIAYGPNLEYMYYRIIFDKDQNWSEIQELFHCDVPEDDIYFQIAPKLISQVKTKNKLICPNYFRITTQNSLWYEMIVYTSEKKTKGTVYAFDKDLNLVKQKKIKIKVPDYSKINND